MAALAPVLVLSFLTSVSGVADYHDPHCGGRQVIVQMFEWKWTDIAQECERYLGPKGFCGVQTSPPNEHTVITTDAMRPWWERYQPVSYKLISRSGNLTQFTDMVNRCKKVGVRIFADVVINHMAGLGRSGNGIAGSHFDSDARDFPGVPFTKANFNDRSKCPSHDGNVNNYGDPHNVRDCNLVGLTDLDGSQSDVQNKVAGYLNHMIDVGVAGFRVDAAKHMWPSDLSAIQTKVKDLPEGGRPMFYLEVIDRNDGAIKVNEYFSSGWVTEFRYMQKVKEGANDLGRLAGVYDPGWGMAPPDQALVFVDNHDTQRGHESLTYKVHDEYKRAQAFTLAYNYGFVRVMSSYYFNDGSAGPPHEADFSTKDVIITPEGSCSNGWVCEHRWAPIGNMVMFRNVVSGQPVNNWRYQNGVLSFSRGTKGFFAMGTQSFSETVATGLPAGEYCDLISECAMKVKVDGSGNAHVTPHDSDVPFVAIVTADVNTQIPTSSPVNTAPTQTPGLTIATEDPPITTPSGQGQGGAYQRTIIIVERQTGPGQDLFIRGGIDHAHRQGCSTDNNKCSVPIKHLNDGNTPHYDKVNAWGVGDNFLDWNGPEPGQGAFNGRVAEGTPAFWSTNDPNDKAYNTLNTYGPHYWIVDVEMDCSKTEGGMFEIKAIVNNQWEGNIQQVNQCTGDGAMDPPYSSTNHFARCGYTNIFHWSNPSCEIHAV